MTRAHSFKSIALGLAVLGSVAVGAIAATPVAHADWPYISVSASVSYLSISGQSFTPGGGVDIYIYSPDYGWSYAGSTTASDGSCNYGTYCFAVGGVFDYGAYASCGYGSSRQEDWVAAYDADSGQWAESSVYIWCGGILYSRTSAGGSGTGASGNNSQQMLTAKVPSVPSAPAPAAAPVTPPTTPATQANTTAPAPVIPATARPSLATDQPITATSTITATQGTAFGLARTATHPRPVRVFRLPRRVRMAPRSARGDGSRVF